jgi:hypothetical protein
MRKEIILRKSFVSGLCAAICLQACQHPVAGARVAKRHLVEISRNGSTLYIDRIDSRQIIKSDSNGTFTAYKIEFEDSVQRDKKYEQDKTVYFEYRLGNDWKAVIDGDSIAPVFFQPVTGLNKMNKEGILVFELPAGKQADALVYDDSFGNWQQQIIALNPHIK